jgi:hypothetical protein
MRLVSVLSITAALVGIASAAPASQPGFGYWSMGFIYSNGHYTRLFIPGSGGGVASGLNNIGDVVGSFDDNGVTKGFVDSEGKYRTVYVPGSSYTDTSGINDSGTISGRFETGSGIKGFLYSGGSYTKLSIPGAFYTETIGVNSSGVVAGNYVLESDLTTHGYIYNLGVYTKIDVPNATDTTIFDINDSGEILGLSSRGLFTESGGAYTFLQSPGRSDFVIPTDLNNIGDVAGFFENPSFVSVGFIDSGGRYTLVNPTGSVGASVNGINDFGTAVGDVVVSERQGFRSHGFILSGGRYITVNAPGYGVTDTQLTSINNSGMAIGVLSGSVPEPAAWTMILLGFGLVGAGLRRELERGRRRHLEASSPLHT